MSKPPGDVTVILHRLRDGEAEAGNELFTMLYGELRVLADALFRSQRRDHTLEPTAVVHEAYLKMLGGKKGEWQDRAHFFAVAARAMRQVLVNHARDKAALKRGGGQAGGRVTLADAAAQDVASELDERQARIAELRFFAGLNHPEIAEVLGRSLRSVELDWKMAKDWLAQRLT